MESNIGAVQGELLPVTCVLHQTVHMTWEIPSAISKSQRWFAIYLLRLSNNAQCLHWNGKKWEEISQENKGGKPSTLDLRYGELGVYSLDLEIGGGKPDFHDLLISFTRQNMPIWFTCIFTDICIPRSLEVFKNFKVILNQIPRAVSYVLKRTRAMTFSGNLRQQVSAYENTPLLVSSSSLSIIYTPSYLRAVADKFAPDKFKTSLRKGDPIFLVGPAMIPNVLNYIIDAQAHTVLGVRVKLLRVRAGTPEAATVNTVTGLAIFNLSHKERTSLLTFETTPFKHPKPVSITIRLSNGKYKTVDAGAFVETKMPDTYTCPFNPPYPSDIDPLLPGNMLTRPHNVWDVAPFLKSPLYTQATRMFEKWDEEHGDDHWDKDWAMDGSDQVGGVTGGEGVEVEGVDGDEIEVHGGREGEGGGWGIMSGGAGPSMDMGGGARVAME
ncbi:hypothetical protein PAAG_05517 [Paracoccidioides lutzii Pb01]|uniref:Uncharacterized protein n=1 Tax=Paracoccidioides lutzii (strain ATCC MYA-826 / Pb01) TaxID=502779 RepID=C1H424_PARBA|nr:hypothetical protein PAAG_05517 [Paracoccidioides lutzii Pb01]EEH34468.1 hypothetical protein PAAG_05517 [Paracoccidioides lutzii Pb01]